MDKTRQIATYAVNLARDRGAQYADCRADKFKVTALRYHHDRFETSNIGVNQGCGIRLLYDRAWGFSYSAKVDKESLRQTVSKAIRTARQLTKIEAKAKLAKTTTSSEKVPARGVGNLEDIPVEDKMKFCETLVKEARQCSSRITTANGFYLEVTGARSIATSDGTVVQLAQSRVYCSIRASARKNTSTVSATEYAGALGGTDAFDGLDPRKLATEAAERAVNSCKGKPVKREHLPVILDPKVAGVFIHEAVGHAAEADFVVSRESILQGKVARRIGSVLLTVYDDPTLENGWGSSKYDDEGTLGLKRTLVRNGILEEYILDRTTANELEMKPNGGAHVQTCSHIPIPRMSNTYVAGGDMTFDELIEDMDRGVVIRGTRGGQADPSSGTFQFSAEDAQLIQNGSLTRSLLGVSLSGNTLTTLNRIDGVGKEVSFLTNYCNKAGQTLPTGTGGPYLRIRDVWLGDSS